MFCQFGRGIVLLSQVNARKNGRGRPRGKFLTLARDKVFYPLEQTTQPGFLLSVGTGNRSQFASKSNQVKGKTPYDDKERAV